MASTVVELPSVRPDRSGYLLDGELVDGFADREDISFQARRQLARLAERYALDELSDSQRLLLRVRFEQGASDLLRALAEDEADLDEAFSEGLYDLLDEGELRRARENDYPVSIGSVADITGATQRQIRHWEAQGLLSGHVVGGQKRYLRGGVLRAMALAKQEQHVIATLGKSAREPRMLVKLIGLVVSDLGNPAQIASTACEFLSVGRMLERSAESKSRHERPASSRSTPTNAPGAKLSAGRVQRELKIDNEVHVLFGNRGWVLKTEGVPAPAQVFPTQAAASQVGQQLARKCRAKLLVHRKDGSIRRKASYV